MVSPDLLQLWLLFQTIAPDSYLDALCREHGYRRRAGIYTTSVVVWLMMCQRLSARMTLLSAVQLLLQSGAHTLQRDRPCKRVRDTRIAASTGGYCQARQKLPTLVATAVTDRLFQQLRSQMQPNGPNLDRPVFVIDGTTVRLQHQPDLVEAFPPGHNQHGDNHWPVMMIVACHDVHTGLAARPSWGPMYGPEPVSEQQLANQALQRLPADAVVMGDANFGIFAFAHAVAQTQRPLLLRLNLVRAQKILKTLVLRNGTYRKVVWQASYWDRRSHPELPEEACLETTVVVCRNPSRPREKLCLLTTLELSAEQILDLYKLRWNIETDLRSLKRSVALHHMTSKSAAMVEKELLLAVSAYNLIRAVMCLGAQRAGLSPRQLSFSNVQTIVMAALPSLSQAATDTDYNQQMDRLIGYAVQTKLPNRSRNRSYPREIWGRGGHFPFRKSSPLRPSNDAASKTK